MPNVTLEDLYQIIGLKDVQLTVATGRALQAEQRVAALEAQLAQASAPKRRRRAE
jgi:hypothetical protein